MDDILVNITYVVFLVIFVLTAIVSLLSIISFGPYSTHWASRFAVPDKYRVALFGSLILEVVVVMIAAGSLAVDSLYKTADKWRLTIESRQPSTLHDYVLLQRDITRVRIFGLNGLGVFHKYRRDIIKMIYKKKTIVEILLLYPESEAFIARSNLEEAAPKKSKTPISPPISQRVSGRIRAEWEASRAILRDIVNQLVNQHSMDIKKLSSRLKIRMHQQKPIYSFLFVDTSDNEHFLIYNEYPQEAQIPGTRGGSSLIPPGDRRFGRAEERFKTLWEANDTKELTLKELMEELKPPPRPR